MACAAGLSAKTLPKSSDEVLDGGREVGQNLWGIEVFLEDQRIEVLEGCCRIEVLAVHKEVVVTEVTLLLSRVEHLFV